MLTALLDILFPPACGACAARLGVLDVPPFCRVCAISVEPLVAPYCLRCGQPFSGQGPSHTCLRCLRTPPPYDMARAALLFGGALLTAIHRYKYSGAWELGPSLGGLIARGAPDVDPADLDLVVPVPLHRRRLAERGFDHVVPLARAVARMGGIAMLPRALERIRHTPPQVSLTGAARRRNLRGAFAARHPKVVSGRRVLLIDDVVTTGATAEACARALRDGGARRVVVLSLARAPA